MRGLLRIVLKESRRITALNRIRMNYIDNITWLELYEIAVSGNCLNSNLVQLNYLFFSLSSAKCVWYSPEPRLRLLPLEDLLDILQSGSFRKSPILTQS